MKNKLFRSSVIGFMLILFATTAYSWNSTTSLIIDHTCTELSSIPVAWIDSIQANLRLHYAHTSHGGQLTTGLSRIENSSAVYNIAIGSRHLPSEPGAFCIFDGQEFESYITPDLYWKTSAGMNKTRNVLNNNPTINLSMWSWCCQLTGYTEAQVQAYLDSITVLETEFPNVTFIYMTCNAQATGAGGYNRYLRNEQIRQYCIANNKVLFDFADLDSWWFNPNTSTWEHATYDYNSHTVPVEHSQFHGSQAGHTTFESCEQKGNAVWWMMAKLAGWSGITNIGGENPITPQDFVLHQNYPNPFNPTTTICYSVAKPSNVQIKIYNQLGQLVRTLLNEYKPVGEYGITWDCRNDQGNMIASGIYFYHMKAGGKSFIKKAVLIR